MTKGKPFLILTISFVIIVGIIIFMIRPVVFSVWQSWIKLKEAETEQQTVEEKKQILESLKNNPKISEVSQIAVKYIPQASDTGQLVIELTAIAGSNSLRVEEMNMEKSKESSASSGDEDSTPAAQGKTPAPASSSTPQVSKEAKEIEFSMKLSGSFFNFMNFLREIETSSRLISIKTIALQNKAASTPEEASFYAQIEGAAYSKKEVSLTNTLENIKISETTIEKFLNLKTFGQPINLPTESGFGRGNPFEGY